MEFFEAIKTFVTATKADKSGFVEVAGTSLSPEYFAYKDSVRSENWWWVVDKASGLAISPKLKTFKDCKEFLTNLSDEEKTKIEQKKAEPFYKEQCAKLAAWKPAETESLDFDVVFEELNTLYEEVEQKLLFEDSLEEKKHNNNSKEAIKADWKTNFFSFDKIGLKITPGIFIPLISAEFIEGYHNFLETYSTNDAAVLANRLNRIVQTLEINGKSRPGNSEKVNGVDHSIYELKIGETESKKPIRSLYFIKTDTDGKKYVIFASLFIHTNKNLTAEERNSGRNAYYLANPKN